MLHFIKRRTPRTGIQFLWPLTPGLSPCFLYTSVQILPSQWRFLWSSLTSRGPPFPCPDTHHHYKYKTVAFLFIDLSCLPHYNVSSMRAECARYTRCCILQAENGAWHIIILPNPLWYAWTETSESSADLVHTQMLMPCAGPVMLVLLVWGWGPLAGTFRLLLAVIWWWVELIIEEGEAGPEGRERI